MKPSAPVQYWLRLNGREADPLTETEILARYGNTLPGNTPCARLGQNEWSTVRGLLPHLAGDTEEIAEPSPPTAGGAEKLADHALTWILSFGIKVGACILALLCVLLGRKTHWASLETLGGILALAGFIGSPFIARELIAIAGQNSKAGFLTILRYRYLPFLCALPLLGPLLERFCASPDRKVDHQAE